MVHSGISELVHSDGNTLGENPEVRAMQVSLVNNVTGCLEKTFEHRWPFHDARLWWGGGFCVLPCSWS